MKSKALKAVYKTAKDLHKANVMPSITMRKFETLCLQSVHKLKPLEIKRLREKGNVSQAVFAAYLNTSISTVQKWEGGEKKPSGLALKLLNLVERKGLQVIA